MELAALKAAHVHSSRHRDELGRSASAWCFFCQETFPADSIVKWTDDDDTALCPVCGIDSVIGDASGLPVVDPGFLSAMHEYWFERELTPRGEEPKSG